MARPRCRKKRASAAVQPERSLNHNLHRCIRRHPDAQLECGRSLESIRGQTKVHLVFVHRPCTPDCAEYFRGLAIHPDFDSRCDHGRRTRRKWLSRIQFRPRRSEARSKQRQRLTGRRWVGGGHRFEIGSVAYRQPRGFRLLERQRQFPWRARNPYRRSSVRNRKPKVTAQSLQPVVLCFGAFQDRNSRVCAFPKCEESQISSFGLALVP